MKYQYIDYDAIIIKIINKPVKLHEEHKKAISLGLKGRPSPTKGMKFGTPSKETRNKISKSNLGKKKNNSKGLMG